MIPRLSFNRVHGKTARRLSALKYVQHFHVGRLDMAAQSFGIEQL
jgi:hypothetical protein